MISTLHIKNIGIIDDLFFRRSEYDNNITHKEYRNNR